MSRWRETLVVAEWEMRRHGLSWLQLAGIVLLAALAWASFRVPVTAFIKFVVLMTTGYAAAITGAFASAHRERREQTLELATSAVSAEHWLDGKLLGCAAGSILVWGCAVLAARLVILANPVVALVILLMWLGAAWLTWRLVRTMLARSLRRAALRQNQGAH